MKNMKSGAKKALHTAW
jgi:hypothetical protein